MHVVEPGGEPELLTDGRLGDAERFGDQALAHADRHHRPECQDAAKPRDVPFAPGVSVPRQEGYKLILSA